MSTKDCVAAVLLCKQQAKEKRDQSWEDAALKLRPSAKNTGFVVTRRLYACCFLVDLWVIKPSWAENMGNRTLRWIVGMVLLIHFVKKNGWTFRRVVAHPRKPHHFLAIEPPGDDGIFF